MTTASEADRELIAVRRLRERLVAGRTHTEREIDIAVARAMQRFDGAPIREFIPVLIERLVREDLRRAADAAEP